MSKCTFFGQKTIFLLKNTSTSKIKGDYALKGTFLKLHMGAYLRAKFEASGIILTSFKQLKLPPPPPQIKPLKSPPRLELTFLFTKQRDWIYILSYN